MDRTVVIDRRCNGPRLSGNGGYVAGVVAGHVDPEGAVEVTLRAPVPLDTPMTLTARGNSTHVLNHGPQLICQARTTTLGLDPPGLQDWDRAERLSAAGGSPAGSDFHDCVVCGSGRAVGDGLRVLPRRCPDRPMSLALYQPHAAHAAADGRIAAAFVWGTLDCPGAWAVQEPDDGRLLVTGRMTAQLFHRPAPGETCMVVGWKIGVEGRKLTAGTALYTRAGRLCALAASTWIALG